MAKFFAWNLSLDPQILSADPQKNEKSMTYERFAQTIARWGTTSARTRPPLSRNAVGVVPVAFLNWL